MTAPWTRDRVIPERELPGADALIARGGARAAAITAAPSPFLTRHGVASEAAFKRREAEAGRLMFHAQVGWRDPELTARNMAEITARVGDRGGRVDRFGICLDWSMGYPPDARAGRTRGTGLVLGDDRDFVRLARASDAAPHFGDFVIGMPAAVENTAAALAAGATSIGNLGQYFTFRLPDWDDDVAITAASVEAMAMCAARPEEILVHSNLDDGFAARFSDLACALGAVMIERHVVETLLGATLAPCYGHTFSDLAVRQAFLLATARVAPGPGSMIYGNTTRFGDNAAESMAALAAYLSADMAALGWARSGHALTPIPVTEATRIPSVDEIVEAQVFAHALMTRSLDLMPAAPPDPVTHQAEVLFRAGRRFFDAVMNGLEERGFDTADAVEVLLALRRIGAPELERAFGPGSEDADGYNGRRPVVAASVVGEIAARADAIVDGLAAEVRDGLKRRKPRVCVAATDVHEYGKRLLEAVLTTLGVETVDGGISVDADDLARIAADAGADAIAVSTYNGIAAAYAEALSEEVRSRDCAADIYIGGRLNAVPDGSNTGLPVDDLAALSRTGAHPCARIEDMLRHLAKTAPAEKGANP